MNCPYSNREMREPRILFVATDLSSGGGVNKVIRDLAVLLNERLGARTEVVSARNDRPSSYAFPSGISVRYRRARSLPAYFALLCALRRTRPDYVIGPWTQDNVLIVLAFLFSGVKTVLVEHAPWNLQGWFVRLLRRLFYPLAWRVIVLNPSDLVHYRRHLGNVRLLPNPVPEIDARGEATREKMIVAVGHLHPRKNFAETIGAMAKSGLEAEGWSLAIIGEGPEQERLQELIGELSLEQTSIHRPTPDLASWYARSSLMLVTSRIEVFSLVLAEAMLCGVVPIAYAADGPRFILEDFPEHLVEMSNVEALAERLQHFAHEPEVERLRKELRDSIRERFSPDVIAEKWKTLLLEGVPDANRQDATNR
jgi:glycosyltransferase involved in cell wall biosynthesis